MLTRNTSFCLLSNRRMDSLALGLKVLANRNGTPRIYYSDRESGIMALAKRGEWLVHENGLTSKEGLTVKYCPAPGHAHVNHSGFESKVKAVKQSLGPLDLQKTPMEATSLYNLLICLESSLNNLPIY